MQGKLGPLIFLVTASIHFTSSQAEDPDGQLSHQNELCQSICIGRLAHFTGCCDAVTLFMYKNEKRSSLYGGEEQFGKRMMDMDRFGKRMMDEDRFGKRMVDMDRFGKRMMDEDRFGKRMMDMDRFGKRMMDEDRFGKRMMDMDRFGKRMMDEDRFGKRMMDEDRFGKRRRKRSSSDSEDILEPSRY
jgi:hypothetical protein